MVGADHIFNNHKGKRTINVKVSGKRYERVDGGKFMDTRVYKNVVVIPVEEVCVIECTGGASSSIRHGYCAMIGGVSIIKLAKDSVFVGRDGIVYAKYSDAHKGWSGYYIEVATHDKKDRLVVNLNLFTQTHNTTTGKRDFQVGRVVLSAFYPQTFAKQTVEHLDGNYRNNTPENLVNCMKYINVAHALKLRVFNYHIIMVF